MADKKVIILIALFIVLAGVGVFQFTKGSQPANTPRPKSDKVELGKASPSTPELEIKVTAPSGPSKDPFEKPAGLGGAEVAGAPNGRTPGPQNGGAPKFPNPNADKRPTAALGGPPLPPLKGNPDAGQPNVEVKEMLNGCGWEVTGIVMGPVPVVVLRSEQGAQALAREGQSVGGNVKIMKISPLGVKVVNKASGKTVKLGIGGGKID